MRIRKPVDQEEHQSPPNIELHPLEFKIHLPINLEPNFIAALRSSMHGIEAEEIVCFTSH